MKNIMKKYRIAVFLTFLMLLSACGTTPETASRRENKTTLANAESSTEKAGSESGDPGTQSITETPTEPVRGESSSTATEEAPTEPVSSEQPAISMQLTFATLNIKHGEEGLDKVADAIRDISPDIIGLEEVDVNCERSGYIDEPAELARLAGYSYYAFSKAIPLGDGEYGTAILSRYPIEDFEVTSLESGRGENRSVGHAVIHINGLKVDALVTHLSYDSRSLRIEQMEAIADMLKDFDHYVLMGDFNSFDIEDFCYLGGAYYVNRSDRPYTTFRRRELAIDNIIVSEGFTELSSGVSDAECSDHKLLYAVFQFDETQP